MDLINDLHVAKNVLLIFHFYEHLFVGQLEVPHVIYPGKFSYYGLSCYKKNDLMNLGQKVRL